MSALLNKMGRRRVTVGMDGSLYKFHPHFHERMVAKVTGIKSKEKAKVVAVGLRTYVLECRTNQLEACMI